MLTRLWIAAPAPLVMGSTMWLWPTPPIAWIFAEYALGVSLVAVSLVARRRAK